MASYWPTLGKYVEGLDKAGKLVRITTPVNKDTELHPLVRLQFRGLPESQRKAFLFENVIDSRGRSYPIPGAGRRAGRLGRHLRARHGLHDRGDRGRVAQALAKPLTPTRVEKGPARRSSSPATN